MSAVGGHVPAQVYEPPEQGLRGQLIDSVIILVLLFAVLFGVTYYMQSSTSASAGKTKPLAALPITPTERQQYQKLIDKGVVDLATVNQQVADNHPDSNKYPIKIGAAILTFGVIAIYLVFVYAMSFKEYREVVRERFGPPVAEAVATDGAEARR
jgi:hypothetical protein